MRQALFFSLSMDLAFLGLSWVHKSFRITSSTSVENVIGNLKGSH